MLFHKILLLLIGFGFLACAVTGVVYDVYLAFELNRILQRTNHSSGASRAEKIHAPHVSAHRRGIIRWNGAAKFAAGKETVRS
jgi:hypothetical protein